MKGSDIFKITIQNYLNERAEIDELFAESLKNPKKSIDDCITYILNTVKDSGNNGFDDSEIFNMAIHYYDEDDVKVGEPITGVSIVSNHHVELSPEEIQEAKERAKEQVLREEANRLKGKTKPPKPDPKDTQPGTQMTLF